MSSLRCVVGAAGHIDHGKTALIRALTGAPGDRLAEEKRRGVTIDIGFASLTLSDGATVGVVDVPGHRKFIHNMMAGAAGIDVALLVVAADDGVMPQTVEHLAILETLGVRRGVVAVTKSDLVDAEIVAMAVADVEELLADSPLAEATIVPCSSLTGDGIDTLKEELARLAAATERNPADGLFRLPVDRVFSMKGHGLVVTGTLFSGSVAVDDKVAVTPGGHEARVRRIQNHGVTEERAGAGTRTALNIVGPAKEAIGRGTVICHPAAAVAHTSFVGRIGAHRSAPLPIVHGKSYLLAIHTAEVLCRVALAAENSLAPGESTFGQLRFDRPINLVYGDRFVLRSSSAEETLGGGVVLAPGEAPMGRRGLIRSSSTWEGLSDPATAVAAAVARHEAGIEMARLIAWFNKGKGELATAFKRTKNGPEEIKTFEWKGEAYAYLVAAGKNIVDRIAAAVAVHHAEHPAVLGIEESSLARRILPETPPELAAYWVRRAASEKKIEYRGALVRLPGREALFTGDEREVMEKVVTLFDATRFAPPRADKACESLALKKPVVQKVIATLVRSGELITVSPEYTVSKKTLAEAERILREAIETAESVDTGSYRDLLEGAGRKAAIELLEYFDKQGVTKRIDNKGRRELTGR
jgi:selenocysteine-specific elongation factor